MTTEMRPQVDMNEPVVLPGCGMKLRRFQAVQLLLVKRYTKYPGLEVAELKCPKCGIQLDWAREATLDMLRGISRDRIAQYLSWGARLVIDPPDQEAMLELFVKQFPGCTPLKRSPLTHRHKEAIIDLRHQLKLDLVEYDSLSEEQRNLPDETSPIFAWQAEMSIDEDAEGHDRYVQALKELEIERLKRSPRPLRESA